MGTVREQFNASPVGVNATVTLGGSMIAGFLAVTSGTLTLTDFDGRVLVDAVPVTAGIYTPLPFFLNFGQGATVTLADGASGTLAV